MGKRDRPPPPTAAVGPFNNPFGDLGRKLGMATATAPTPTSTPGPTSAATSPPGPARAVVRLERKGRGGKEVTVVEKLELSSVALELWATELKRALGVGGAVEGASVVLQGDVRDRVTALLTARGVKKVTRG